MGTGMTVVGGLGYTNCSYGFGTGNGYGTAGFGEVVCLTSEKPAVATAPGVESAPMPELALETFTEPEPTRLEKLAALAALMGWTS